jgi:hypothetical protein
MSYVSFNFKKCGQSGFFLFTFKVTLLQLCYYGILLQLLCFWALSIILSLFKPQHSGDWILSQSSCEKTYSVVFRSQENLVLNKNRAMIMSRNASCTDLPVCLNFHLQKQFLQFLNNNTLQSVFQRTVCIYDHNNSICFFSIAFFV